MRLNLLCVLLMLAACSDDDAPPTQDDDHLPPDHVTRIAPTFTFESGPVRPLALSRDGTKLYVANTANASLDILDVGDSGLTRSASVFVGIDPVAIAERVPGEVWVVNAISDSVSIVDTQSSPPYVKRTVLVGDEPSDIVFASGRAFVTTAHRGQRRTDPALAGVPGAGDPQLTTPGVGRADVWVFDGANPEIPLAILVLFGEAPRGLAVTPDGATVYAAIFHSGNQTMAISSEMPCAGFDSPSSSSPCTVRGTAIPGAPPGPGRSAAGVRAPAPGMILKADSAGVWRDILGRDWTSATAFTLPDQDVFAINAATLATSSIYTHVGTTLFNVAVNPVNGHVYVSNTEARNDLRFEGSGASTGETVQGHLAESRITVLDGSVKPRHLNKHIDYAVLPAAADTARHSLSTPLDMAVSPDGNTLYVAAFGSSKVGVFATAELENDTFDPRISSAAYLTVSGGGPAGLALDAARNRLYVATRFDDGVSVVDLASRSEIAHVVLEHHEPTAITDGRKFLYDATRSSSNGEAACASCHMFGDNDHLVWDLGNPDGDVVSTAALVRLGLAAPSTINGTGEVSEHHPMKGPMATQTLRGLINHGAMHWRGDRASGFFGSDDSVNPPYDALLSFDNFIVAFTELLGRAEPIAEADMHAFTDFAMRVVMPPNPVRALDNQLNASQAAGRSFYIGCEGELSVGTTCGGLNAGHFADGVSVNGFGFTCNGCHVVDAARGFFGTDGASSFEALPQVAKVPQLRNMYDKVGMFGAPASRNINPGDNGFKGAQVRGSGFMHDGGIDTLFRFFQSEVFNASDDGRIGFTGGDAQRRNVEQYVLAFDNDLAPIVGQQVTLRADNAASAGPRIDLLMQRAGTQFVSQILGGRVRECDLIARSGSVTYVLRSDGAFGPDDGGAVLADTELRARASIPGHEVTYTCMPPGWVR